MWGASQLATDFVAIAISCEFLKHSTKSRPGCVGMNAWVISLYEEQYRKKNKLILWWDIFAIAKYYVICFDIKVEESVYAKGPNFSALNQAIIGEWLLINETCR